MEEDRELKKELEDVWFRPCKLLEETTAFQHSFSLPKLVSNKSRVLPGTVPPRWLLDSHLSSSINVKKFQSLTAICQHQPQCQKVKCFTMS